MKDFKTDLGEYKVLSTEDGTFTLYSSFFDEACHSSSGATEETKCHYIEGSSVIENVTAFNEAKIFEVGFATGLGYKITIDELERNKLQKPISFFSVEIDEGLVKWTRDHTAIESDFYPNLKDLKAHKFQGMTYYRAHKNGAEIVIFIGDARKNEKNIIEYIGKNKIHSIYQDAFSPRQNPALWTKEWFSFLYEIAHNDCVMSTYSSANVMRKSMLAAGFKLYEGKTFGRKRRSTIARKSGESEREVLDRLSRSPLPMLEDKAI